MASTRLGETLRSIQLLFSGQSVVGQPDAALLRRFVTSRDEEAFCALVARHGPMVCAVCRDVLRDSHEVEDAFQATFLILVRRAGSLWVDESLGGWLYRVAYHVSIRANREASRRRTREQVGADLAAFPAPATTTNKPPNCTTRLPGCPSDIGGRSCFATWKVCPSSKPPECSIAARRPSGADSLARERLRNRLAVRGVPPLVLGKLGAAGAIAQSALPAGLVETTMRVALAMQPASALATRLAGSVARASVFGKCLKLVLVAGVLSAAVAAYAFTRADDDRGQGAKPLIAPVAAAKIPPQDIPDAKSAPVKKAELVPVRWVHLKSDRGAEYWANLDTAIEFQREGKTVSMLDAARRQMLTYRGVRRRDQAAVAFEEALSGRRSGSIRQGIRDDRLRLSGDRPGRPGGAGRAARRSGG